MASVKIIGTGRLDDCESAFPQAVELADGDILCSFCVGGGPNVTGGTECARSSDGGLTWTPEGHILRPTEDPCTSNALKLSVSRDGKTIYATHWSRERGRFGIRWTKLRVDW